LSDRRPPRSGPTRTPAVVVGLDSITGLQTARLLAARAVPVVGVASDGAHWGARTRACVDVVESALEGDGLMDALTALGPRLGTGAVLFPCTDASVATISRRRAELPDGFILPLAAHDVVERLMDKVGFARYATEAGLPVPRTEVLRSRQDAQEAARRLGFPCLVKPSVKTGSWLARTRAKGFVAQDAPDLLAIYTRVADWSPALVAQEWVDGPEDALVSCNAYFGQDGRALATFVARKVRQWPPGVGTSASGEECRNDEVLDTTIRLFAGARYHGLAYLEMKRDARSGRMVIIEPNVGRPTGRSAISEAGGVELVHTAYCDALGLPLPAQREQHYGGAKWVDVRRDAQAVMVARRQGTGSVRQWLGWMRGPKAHAIWSRDDPAPFVADMVGATLTGARMLAARRRPSREE
jgi:D-aspartate ligase